MSDTLTYGERAVGLNFNPSGDAKVHRLKMLFASIIDELQSLPDRALMQHKLRDEAITQAMTAQMWAVKAATWRE